MSAEDIHDLPDDAPNKLRRSRFIKPIATVALFGTLLGLTGDGLSVDTAQQLRSAPSAVRTVSTVPGAGAMTVRVEKQSSSLGDQNASADDNIPIHTHEERRDGPPERTEYSAQPDANPGAADPNPNGLPIGFAEY